MSKGHDEFARRHLFYVEMRLAKKKRIKKNECKKPEMDHSIFQCINVILWDVLIPAYNDGHWVESIRCERLTENCRAQEYEAL